MKKVLHIITRLDKGGSTEDVLYNCIYLQNLGYKSTLLYGRTLNPEEKLIKEANIAGVKFINVNCLIREINFFYDILAFIKIFKIIKLEQPDIVHTHTSKAGILGRWATWLYRYTTYDSQYVKIVHSSHGHVFYGYYNKFISRLFILAEKITAKITDKLVALTENEIKESLSYGIGRSFQWTVVHSGVEYNSKLKIKNSKLKKELNIPDTALVVGTVARLDPVKGVKYFVDAIIKISDLHFISSDLRFLIVGDGQERKMLEHKIKNSSIKDKVFFVGWQENVEDYISIMDIYVQPSLNEGMGKTIIQAQLLSKPVIATEVQGIISIIKNGETGLLVPPKNSEKLAEQIIRLVKSQELREKLGSMGEKFVLQKEQTTNYYKFSIELMNYLIKTLYENL